ncbi:MAG TPA: Ig-like domain-containing protein [Nitrososphaeraceae archaeon]|nr:Ig-like domain-containing protein [Nitrososphaeraceae archaeon]
MASDVYASYVVISKWGSYGMANGQFDAPFSAIVDSSGNVFVADTINNRIQKFQLSNPCPTGTTQVVSGVCFVTTWGSLGTANGQFSYPYGIAVDSSGNVFVADGNNERIQKFQLSNSCPTGTTQVVSGVCFVTKWGSQGIADGQFEIPWGIAVDSSNNVFVADTANHRIQKFTNSGTFVTKWGSQGTADGQFSSPVNVAVDISGNVFVVDNDNFRIQKFVDDTIPPTVTITSPPNESTFIAPATETINVNATDNLGIKQVQLYVNNKLLDNDKSYPYSITLTNVPLGVYSLTAKAYDIADNTKTSTPVTVKILPRK